MTIARKYQVPKKLFDGGKIVPGLALFVLVLLLPMLYTWAAGGTKTRPTLKLPAVAKDCPPGEICERENRRAGLADPAGQGLRGLR